MAIAGSRCLTIASRQVHRPLEVPPLLGAFPMKVHRARVERPPRTTGGRERATRVGEGCAVNQASYESRRVWRYTVAGCLGVIVAVTGNTPAHPCRASSESNVSPANS